MPEIGRQVARLLNEFRRASNEFRSQIESEVNSLDGGGKTAAALRSRFCRRFQAPLGSLANRIFNPPPPKSCEVAVPPLRKCRPPGGRIRDRSRASPPAAPKVAPDA
jgi:hypothetical protein